MGYSRGDYGGSYEQHRCRPHAGRESWLGASHSPHQPASPQRHSVSQKGLWLVDLYVSWGEGAGATSRTQTRTHVTGLPRPQASTYLQKGEANLLILARSMPLLPFITQQCHCNASHNRADQWECQGCGQTAKDERGEGGNSTQRYRSIKGKRVM